MDELFKRIAKLLELKSLMSLAALYVFVKLALSLQIDVKDTMLIIVMVFQSFFQYQANKTKDGEK